jgi:hypothetical protein
MAGYEKSRGDYEVMRVGDAMGYIKGPLSIDLGLNSYNKEKMNI